MLQHDIDCKKCNLKTGCIAKYLSSTELSYLAENKTNFKYKKGETIFSQNQLSKFIYFIQEGTIKIIRSSGNNLSAIASLAGSGDLIGFETLLPNKKYVSSALTLTESFVCRFEKSFFIDFLNQYEQSSSLILNELIAQLTKAYDTIYDLMNKPVKSRLAKALLMLNPSDNELISVSREDLARMIGATRETVTRMLTDFKINELIDIEQRKIAVKNRLALSKIGSGH